MFVTHVSTEPTTRHFIYAIIRMRTDEKRSYLLNFDSHVDKNVE